MKYVKLFDTETEYTTYKASEDYVVPNVSYIKETEGVEYDPYEKKTYVFESLPIEEVSIVGELNQDNLKTTITSVNIPSGFTGIEGAFNGFTSLETVTFPNTLTSIGSQAFYYCTSLTDINIPDSVTSIGGGAFNGCTSLTSIVIPDSVTSIGGNAFQNCSSLTSVKIGSGVTNIGGTTGTGHTFKDCSSLDYTEFASMEQLCNIYFKSEDCNPTYQSHKLYVNGERVTNLVIPSTVTSIGDFAFVGCEGFTSVTIPSTVTSIGEKAFSATRSGIDLVIPDSVTSIGKNAFVNSFANIEIGTGITSIGQTAFQTTNTSIFVKIQSITIKATNPPTIGTDAFKDSSNTKYKIYVPAESVTAYQTAWSTYASRIEAIPNS